MNPSPHISAAGLWSFASTSVVCLFLLVSCGSANLFSSDRRAEPSTDQQVSQVRKVSAVSEGESVVPASTQIRAKFSSELLPIGLLLLTTEGVERRCMVSSIGNGQAITAGHCFAGIPTLEGPVSCPAQLKIEWLTVDGLGNYTLSGQTTSCVTFKILSIAGDDSLDVATLKLGEVGAWPLQQVQFEKQDLPVTSVQQGMVGPVTTDNAVSFLTSAGNPYDVSDSMFLLSGSYQPGYSGTPVFRFTLGQKQIDFSSAAVGIHLGRGFGASRVLRAKIIENTGELSK